MKKRFTLILSFLLLVLVCRAQKGNNELQVAGQLAIPTGKLGTVAKLGFGASAKALFGFGSIKQQATIELGFNRWGVKDKYLPQGVNAQYRSIPILAGYRFYFGKLYFEQQVGAAFNTIYAGSQFDSNSEYKTYFAWATSAGYSIKQLDFALRYQSSDVQKESNDINFIGLRVGYRFPFNKRTEN